MDDAQNMNDFRRKINDINYLLKPKSDKKCESCGICAKLCPVNAIPLDDPKETNSEKCISCMRCISICPKKQEN